MLQRSYVGSGFWNVRAASKSVTIPDNQEHEISPIEPELPI